MVKPRENRVPIMMSDAELNAIDDWRFSNRVATRSDAVRRLCYLGLLLDRKVPSLYQKVVRMSAKDLLPTNVDQDSAPEVPAAWALAFNELELENTKFRLEVLLELSTIVSEASGLRMTDTKEAITLADDIRREIEKLGIDSEAGRDRIVEILRAIGGGEAGHDAPEADSEDQK